MENNENTFTTLHAPFLYSWHETLIKVNGIDS